MSMIANSEGLRMAAQFSVCNPSTYTLDSDVLSFRYAILIVSQTGVRLTLCIPLNQNFL